MTYETVITWTPDTANFAGYSDDAANGDRAVITWSTDLTSGSGSSADITDLRVDLYGNGVLVQTDSAVINGVVQPLPGIDVGREDLPLGSAVDLDFDLDNTPNFLTSIDTDPDGLIETQPHSETGWVFFYSDGGNILNWKYEGNTRQVDESTAAQSANATVSTSIPPVTIPALGAWGLFGLIGGIVALLCGRVSRRR